MLHPSTQKLIDRLAAMTAQKKIDWIEKDNGEVIYATEGYVVRLTPEPPRVLLTTESGKSLEDATTSLLTSAVHAEGGTYGDLVASIARNACREARGTEDAINAVLAGLSEDTEETVETAADEAPEPEEVEAEAQPDEPADDEVIVAAAALPASIMEDAGDDSNVLTGDDTVEMAAETPANGWNETQPGADASVPEAAMIEEEAASFADEGLDSGDGEDDVSGAVARLADEVNAAEEAESAAAEPEAAIAEETIETVAEDIAEDVDSEPVAAFSEPDTIHAAEDLPAEDTNPEIQDEADVPAEPDFSFMPDQHQEAAPAGEPEPVQFSAEPQDAALPEEAAALPVETEEVEAVKAVETDQGTAVTDIVETVETSEEEAVEEDTPAPAEAVQTYTDNVRYVPFGAAAAAPTPAEETPEMPETETASTEEVEAAEGDTYSAEAATDEAPTPETEAAPDDIASPPSASSPMTLSISGFSAGLGFGATQTGFTPTPPKPASPSTGEEFVGRPAVVIDATEDYPADFSGSEEPAPDVADMEFPAGLDDDQGSASAEDVAAVSPEAVREPVPAEADAGDAAEQEELQTVRPKTRFNPWT